jgi:branched-chain amino acid transport system ATP-binding protein
MLELQDVHTYYGDSHILQGISLQVGEHEAIGLLGRNGVGKTTTMHTIIGFTPARRGSIRFDGNEIAALPAHTIARLGIGLVPQGRRIFRSLSVRENLTMAARSGARQGWTLEQAFERFPRLKERLNNYGDQLSGGEQEMLAIARAMMTGPRLVLMDEPSEGLAPMVVREIEKIIATLKQDGVPLILAEQNLAMALEIVDRVYVLSKGSIVFEGAPRVLLANEELHRQYLGV